MDLEDTAGVLKKLNEIDDIINQNSIAPGAMAIYVAMKGFMLIEQNELEKANTFFKENGLEYDKKMSYSEEHGYSAFALFLIVEKKYEEAEFLLLKLIKMAEIANRKERIIENKIVYAFLNKSIGDKAKAIKKLGRSSGVCCRREYYNGFYFL